MFIRAIRGSLFSARSFCAFRAFCGNIFSPTDGTDLHRCLECAVLQQNTEFGSVDMAGMPYPPNLCSSVPSVGVFSLPEGSVRSVHSVGGVAVVWCSRDCCTPWWVYPCHPWEVLSAIGFRVFGVFCRRSTPIKFVVKNFAPTP